MEFLSVKEVAEKWGYNESTIRRWCRDGVIKVTLKAKKKSGRWQIPANAQCPKSKERIRVLK